MNRFNYMRNTTAKDLHTLSFHVSDPKAGRLDKGTRCFIQSSQDATRAEYCRDQSPEVLDSNRTCSNVKRLTSWASWRKASTSQ